MEVAARFKRATFKLSCKTQAKRKKYRLTPIAFPHGNEPFNCKQNRFPHPPVRDLRGCGASPKRVPQRNSNTNTKQETVKPTNPSTPNNPRANHEVTNRSPLHECGRSCPSTACSTTVVAAVGFCVVGCMVVLCVTFSFQNNLDVRTGSAAKPGCCACESRRDGKTTFWRQTFPRRVTNVGTGGAGWCRGMSADASSVFFSKNPVRCCVLFA